MLPTLLFQTIGFVLNLAIVLFVIYYLVHLRTKEKKLEQKENSVDTNYHHVVDEALSKERKILDDAADEASEIISSAEYINASSQHTVDQAMDKMLGEVKTDAAKAATDFKQSYATSLDQIAQTSLSDFQTITKELQTDLQKQIKDFHAMLLPSMQKELEEYKKERYKQTEQTITRIVQEASQEILNKSISFDDHQKLLTESLEKAKKEGLFE